MGRKAAHLLPSNKILQASGLRAAYTRPVMQAITFDNVPEWYNAIGDANNDGIPDSLLQAGRNSFQVRAPPARPADALPQEPLRRSCRSTGCVVRVPVIKHTRAVGGEALVRPRARMLECSFALPFVSLPTAGAQARQAASRNLLLPG